MYIAKKQFPDVTTVARRAHVGIMRGMARQASLSKAKKKKEASIFALVVFILSHRPPPSEMIKLMNRHIAKKKYFVFFYSFIIVEYPLEYSNQRAVKKKTSVVV